MSIGKNEFEPIRTENGVGCCEILRSQLYTILIYINTVDCSKTNALPTNATEKENKWLEIMVGCVFGFGGENDYILSWEY